MAKPPLWRETLLSPTGIKLYGRVIVGLDVKLDSNGPPDAPPELGDNNFLRKQLEAKGKDGKPSARFARIYAFSYEGHYYDLPNPAIFLVHTDGEQAWVDSREFPGGPNTPFPEASPGAGTVSQAGVAAKGWDLLEDIRVWQYEKGDFSIRLDIETGPFEQILLGLGASDAAYGGANVSGANVRGANVRGANVRGANVRGANVRGGNSD